MPGQSRSGASSIGALGASLLLHVGMVALGFGLLSTRPPPVSNWDAGSWSGQTFEVSETSVVPGFSQPGQARPRPTDPAAPAIEPDTSPPPADGTPSATSAAAGDTRLDEPSALSTSEAHTRPKSEGATPAPQRSPKESPPRHAPAEPTPHAKKTPGTAVTFPSPRSTSTVHAEGPGSTGAEGAAIRRGRLPNAFTRALPAAARGDASWIELPPGDIERFVVQVDLDTDGAVQAITTSHPVSPRAERLLRVTRLLLRSGRFALPQEGRAGRFELGLRIRVEAAPAQDDNDHPAHVEALGSRYPEATQPGEAYVTFAAGKKLVLEVHLAPRAPDFPH